MPVGRKRLRTARKPQYLKKNPSPFLLSCLVFRDRIPTGQSPQLAQRACCVCMCGVRSVRCMCVRVLRREPAEANRSSGPIVPCLAFRTLPSRLRERGEKRRQAKAHRISDRALSCIAASLECPLLSGPPSCSAAAIFPRERKRYQDRREKKKRFKKRLSHEFPTMADTPCNEQIGR